MVKAFHITKCLGKLDIETSLFSKVIQRCLWIIMEKRLAEMIEKVLLEIR